MLNPFGNVDEPDPPTWFREHWPRLPPRWLRFMWYVRNPLHNFTHYMIGWAGHSYVVSQRSARDDDNDGFADDGGWLRCRLVSQNQCRPFVSYAGRIHCYLGWHPASGKFGLRLTF